MTINECAGCRALATKLEAAGSDRSERIVRQEILDHQHDHHGVSREEQR